MACLGLLDRLPDLTAFVCGDDIVAQGAIAAAAVAGRRIPDDVSVIGIGDFAGSADMVPALTTARLPARSIGEAAGRHLVDAISDPEPAGRFTRRLIPAELLERSITGPVAGTGPIPRRRASAPATRSSRVPTACRRAGAWRSCLPDRAASAPI